MACVRNAPCAEMAHNEAVSKTQPFVIWGYIAAPKLPDAAQIGRAHIKRQDEVQIAKMPKSRASLKHPEGGPPEFLSVTAPEILVRSRWTIFFHVSAEDSEAAFARVENTYLPPVVAALSTSVEGLVAVDLVRIAEEDPDGRHHNSHAPWSLSLKTSQFAVEAATPAEVERANRLAELALRDVSAKQVSELYSQARRLDLLDAGLPPLQAAALLAYYKVIESVVEKNAKGRKLGSDDEAGEAVEHLRNLLGRPASRKTKTAQILNAAIELRRLQGAYLSQKVVAAGEALGVGGADVEAAVALGKLRNKALSHAGELEHDDLGPLLLPAEKAARAYLAAHLDSLL